MFNNFPAWSLILIYIVLAVAICFLSKKLADYVDALDKKTKISGAFIGAVLLAAVTSLPELFTSISATLLLPDSANLVTGNILGSNLFDIAIFGIAALIFFKGLSKASFKYKSHFIVLGGVAVIYVIIGYGLFLSPSVQPIFGKEGYFASVNWLSILILVTYGLTVHFQPKESDEDEEKIDTYQNITLKQVIIRFIICALLLVTSSILITYDTDALSVAFHLDATLAGAIFLAVATSLPELVSTITLCKKGNYDAALGDITGSCLFNFLIISISEFLAYKTSLLPGGGFTSNLDGCLMLIITVIGVITLVCTLLVSKYRNKNNIPATKKTYFFYAAIGFLLFASYFVYLVLSFILK